MTLRARSAKADHGAGFNESHGHQWLHDLGLALNSCYRFIGLVVHGSFHRSNYRLGETYRTDRGGNYSVFLDTTSHDEVADPDAVLVVGFRLRWINSNSLLHRIFRRICITSTPIWSGFPGYREKLWMVDFATENYLGIYEWAGEKNALVYAEWLSRLLHPLCASGSVWYELYPDEKIGSYLEKHRISNLPLEEQHQALYPAVVVGGK